MHILGLESAASVMGLQFERLCIHMSARANNQFVRVALLPAVFFVVSVRDKLLNFFFRGVFGRDPLIRIQIAFIE